MSKAMATMIDKIQEIAEPILAERGIARLKFKWWGDFFPGFMYSLSTKSTQPPIKQASEGKMTNLRKAPTDRLLRYVAEWEKVAHGPLDESWEWRPSRRRVMVFVLKVIDGVYDSDESCWDRSNLGTQLREHCGFTLLFENPEPVISSLLDESFLKDYFMDLMIDWHGIDSFTERQRSLGFSLRDVQNDERYECSPVDLPRMKARSLLALLIVSALIGPDDYSTQLVVPGEAADYRTKLMRKRPVSTQDYESSYAHDSVPLESLNNLGASSAQLVPLRFTGLGEFATIGDTITLPSNMPFLLGRFGNENSAPLFEERARRSGKPFKAFDVWTWPGQNAGTAENISNFHVEMYCRDGVWYLSDGFRGKKSKHGTLLIRSGENPRFLSGTQVLLHHGDIITLAPEKRTDSSGTDYYQAMPGMAAMRFEMLS